jgi:hypothetical protein
MPSDLPPDVLDEIEHARAAHGGTLPPGFRVTRRITPRWRPWLMFGVIVVVVAGFAGLQLLSAVRRMESERGLSAQAMRIAELEARLADQPDDADAARELAGLYVNRLIRIQALLGMREVDLDAVSGAEGLNATKEDRIAAYEAGMQISADPQEARRLAAAGLALADGFLARSDLSGSDRGTFLVVRGYCRLALGRPGDARADAESATAIDGRDVRPHLLNAAIAEQQKDYDTAVRELEAAMAKLDAWVARGPSLLQEFVWGMGRTPTGERREWERRRRDMSRRIADSIRARLIILRTLRSAQARGIEV